MTDPEAITKPEEPKIPVTLPTPVPPVREWEWLPVEGKHDFEE